MVYYSYSQNNIYALGYIFLFKIIFLGRDIYWRMCKHLRKLGHVQCIMYILDSRIILLFHGTVEIFHLIWIKKFKINSKKVKYFTTVISDLIIGEKEYSKKINKNIDNLIFDIDIIFLTEKKNIIYLMKYDFEKGLNIC